MRGMKAKDLEAIVDFIYYGETNIYQEDLEDFLSLAEELQLKGLTGSDSETNDTIKEPTVQKEKERKYQTKKDLIYASKATEVTLDTTLEEYQKNSKDFIDTQVVLSEDVNKEELEAKKMSLMEKVENGIINWRCTVCGKTAKTTQNMKTHIETHLEGLSYPCNKCGKVTRSSNSLHTHISVFHRS